MKISLFDQFWERFGLQQCEIKQRTATGDWPIYRAPLCIMLSVFIVPLESVHCEDPSTKFSVRNTQFSKEKPNVRWMKGCLTIPSLYHGKESFVKNLLQERRRRQSLKAEKPWRWPPSREMHFQQAGIRETLIAILNVCPMLSCFLK